MKKQQDFAETVAAGAREVVETLEQAARLIDAEWQRIISSVEESETVPDQVKEVFERFDSAVDSVRCKPSEATEDSTSGFSDDLNRAAEETKKFVNDLVPVMAETAGRVARQFGVTLPDEWPWNGDGDVEDDLVDDVVETPADLPPPPPAEPKAEKKTSTKAKTAAKAKKKPAAKAKKKATAKAKTSSKTKTSSKAKASTKAEKSAAKKTARKKATAKKATPKKKS